MPMLRWQLGSKLITKNKTCFQLSVKWPQHFPLLHVELGNLQSANGLHSVQYSLSLRLS